MVDLFRPPMATAPLSRPPATLMMRCPSRFDTWSKNSSLSGGRFQKVWIMVPGIHAGWICQCRRLAAFRRRGIAVADYEIGGMSEAGRPSMMTSSPARSNSGTFALLRSSCLASEVSPGARDAAKS